MSRNNYSVEDYERLRKHALNFIELRITDDLPVEDFLDVARARYKGLSIPPAWQTEAILRLIAHHNAIYLQYFSGYDYDAWSRDLKEMTQESLDEF